MIKRLLVIVGAVSCSLWALGQVTYPDSYVARKNAAANATTLNTTNDVTYYVSPNDAGGSDSNNCTSASTPCATCAGAAARIAQFRNNRNNSIVQFSAGTYAGCTFEGGSNTPSDFPFVDAGAGLTPGGSSSLTVTGTLQTAALGGTMTGLITACATNNDTTFDTFSASAPGWTVNALAGALVNISCPASPPAGGVFNTGSTETFVIKSNTASVATIVGHFTNIANYVGPFCNSTCTYTIQTWGTTLTSNTNLPQGAGKDMAGNPADLGAAIVISNWRGAAVSTINEFTSPFQPMQSDVLIENLNFGTATQRGVYADESGKVSVGWNKFSGSTATGGDPEVSCRNCSSLVVFENAALLSGGSGQLTFTGTSRYGATPSLAVIGNYVTGGIGFISTPMTNATFSKGTLYTFGNWYTGGTATSSGIGAITIGPGMTEVQLTGDQINSFTTNQAVGVLAGYALPAGAAGLISPKGITLTINSISVTNCTGDGIAIRGANAAIAKAVGSGNGGFGINVMVDAKVGIDTTNTTITGTSGDIQYSGGKTAPLQGLADAGQLADLVSGVAVTTGGYPITSADTCVGTTCTMPGVLSVATAVGANATGLAMASGTRFAFDGQLTQSSNRSFLQDNGTSVFLSAASTRDIQTEINGVLIQDAFPDGGTVFSGAVMSPGYYSGASAAAQGPAGFSTTSTTSPEYGCSGAASCDLQSASGQILRLLTNGGSTIAAAFDTTGNMQLLTGTSLSTSTATGTLTVTGGTGASNLNLGSTTAASTNLRGAAGAVQVNGNALDQTFCVYNAGNLASATAFGETTLTAGATVDTGSKITQDVVGVGGGNFVVMVCTDGTTCAGGNQRLTYTESCAAAAGTRTAATVQNSGTVSGGTVLTMSVTTACATTDPGVNVCIHYHY